MIVCTAGHVDHGKTALVKALTGVDTDRLAEERRRGLTIELGFAPLALTGLGQISVVDVPGHAQFIPTMLSGCSGMDGTLLAVAADEGPMPQTAEHLAILSLLGVERGVVALTRADLASPEQLEGAAAQTAALVKGTFLEGAPMVPVSAVTGQGLDNLRAALSGLLAQAPPPPEGSSERWCPGRSSGKMRESVKKRPDVLQHVRSFFSGFSPCRGAGRRRGCSP